MIDLKFQESLQMSQIESFVNSLPDGIHTNMGERGLKISGGQSQRISIARALYKNSDIIIFDEATSALDQKTSEELVKDIFSLRKHKTIIFATHKLDLIKSFDHVYEIVDKKLLKILI